MIVTELEQTKASLDASERQFHTFVEYTSDIVARYDRECRLVYANPALIRASKLGVDTLLGKTPAESAPFPQAAGAAFTDLLRQVIADAEAREMEVQWESDEQPVCIQMRVTPEFDDQGRVAGAFAIGHNVSALKHSEARLRKSHDILRALVQHRENEHEAERREIARQIHEELAQNLSALRMNIALVAFQDAAAPFRAPLKAMVDISDRCIVRIRDMVSMLRPTILELGIAQALRWLSKDFAKGIGLHFRFELDIQDNIRLDDDKSTFLFRAAQEALVNMTLHAAASRASITLRQNGDRCRLGIRDNGRGFDPAAAYPAGAFGLIRLDEQARHLGGSLSIASSPGQGTSLELDLPAERPAGRREKAGSVLEIEVRHALPRVRRSPTPKSARPDSPPGLTMPECV